MELHRNDVEVLRVHAADREKNSRRCIELEKQLEECLVMNKDLLDAISAKDARISTLEKHVTGNPRDRQAILPDSFNAPIAIPLEVCLREAQEAQIAKVAGKMTSDVVEVLCGKGSAQATIFALYNDAGSVLNGLSSIARTLAQAQAVLEDQMFDHSDGTRVTSEAVIQFSKVTKKCLGDLDTLQYHLSGLERRIPMRLVNIYMEGLVDGGHEAPAAASRSRQSRRLSPENEAPLSLNL
jgi:hypothetical protein